MTAASPSAAGDLSLKTIALLKSARSLAELTPERIEAATGVDLRAVPGQTRRHAGGEALDADWWYAMQLDASDAGGRFELSFRPTPGTDPSMAALCPVGLERAADELQAAGFDRHDLRAAHGGIDRYLFTRDGLKVELYTRGESAAEPSRECVWMLVAR